MVLVDFKDCREILSTSTKLLGFFVNYMLSFSQISAGKFRKNLSNFNVKKAI